jgi:hypothetical protein
MDLVHIEESLQHPLCFGSITTTASNRLRLHHIGYPRLRRSAISLALHSPSLAL